VGSYRAGDVRARRSATGGVMHPVEEHVRTVRDPELGHVTIGELGLVKSVHVDESGHAEVALVPTFSGCPALAIIAADAHDAAIAGGARSASVRFDHSVPWTTALVSVEGRASLAELGIAVASESETTCPYCSSVDLSPVSAVGPAACRSAWWCNSCRTVVDVFRDSAVPSQPVVSVPFPVRRGNYVHV
jgi:ring-1,2-phenylacetyl-CoA epoxidase subunit PaaD